MKTSTLYAKLNTVRKEAALLEERQYKLQCKIKDLLDLIGKSMTPLAIEAVMDVKTDKPQKEKIRKPVVATSTVIKCFGSGVVIDIRKSGKTKFNVVFKDDLPKGYKIPLSQFIDAADQLKLIDRNGARRVASCVKSGTIETLTFVKYGNARRMMAFANMGLDGKPYFAFSCTRNIWDFILELGSDDLVRKPVGVMTTIELDKEQTSHK